MSENWDSEDESASIRVAPAPRSNHVYESQKPCNGVVEIDESWGVGNGQDVFAIAGAGCSFSNSAGRGFQSRGGSWRDRNDGERQQRGRGRGGRGSRPNGFSSREGEASVEMEVDSSMVGKIIGKDISVIEK